MLAPILGLPHVSVANHAPTRRVFRQVDFETGLAGGKVIDGTKCRDAGSVDNSGYLRPGLVMGKVTASKKYANSVIGLSTGALTGAGTTLASSAAIATEINRRIGATGTVKISGPPAAAGVVKTLTATYSALNLTTGDITVTALGANQVDRIKFNVASTAGNLQLTVQKTDGTFVTTANIAWNATDATYLAAINSALDTATGVTAGIVATAISAVDPDLGFELTYSGAGYVGLPWTAAQVQLFPTSSTAAVYTRITAAVDGRFVSGSLIQPADGSETPLTLLPDAWNWNLIDQLTGAAVDIPFAGGRFPIAGIVESAQLIPWPADTSLQAWLKAALRAAGQFVFDDPY